MNNIHTLTTELWKGGLGAVIWARGTGMLVCLGLAHRDRGATRLDDRI
jgi:hypothetical protein